ncbi:AAA family ATPase [Pseudalkalibacillus berkeleyi]|uniref:MoxR family ATPase n=1 Tax=Pseudalkalibacillus berkeleyi TaxID=1069813 RepID=A0ABS9H3M6_9BACL|nr:MoxR family ATPase [Pseudalkalibacillus berkeleyi]MCF6139547.1 MoxR family ATPase [Pseudalkalibacillus berkeleyi]
MAANNIRYESYHPQLKKVVDNVENVMVGKRQATELSIVSLLTGGHILLEDVPGVGKTMMVRSIAQSIGAKFNRIQFTPDLLPSDLTGVSIYNQKSMEFEFRAGPLMGNIVLADEINRTSPKTQSALLEAMEEQSITVDGVTHKLPNPFFVMATQNPIEYEGTYPLPEAQLDRFLLKINMGYPSAAEEMQVLSRNEKHQPIDELAAVLEIEDLLKLQEQVKTIFVEESVKQYIIDLVIRTRKHSGIHLGVSPRGSLALMKTAQAYALLLNREYVVPDDIKYLAKSVLCHRIILKPEARFDGYSPEKVVEEILERTPVPVLRKERV